MVLILWSMVNINKMVKKKITIDISVTQPISVYRTFSITKEIEVDEYWKKTEGWCDEEYAQENFSSEFEDEAKKLMDKEVESLSFIDGDYEDYEMEWDY